MSVNTGFIREKEFIEYFNNRAYNDLNENMKQLVLFINNNTIPKEKIQCNKGQAGQKPDAILLVDGISKPISLKVGTGNSVHQEQFSEFLTFLRSIGINEKTIDLLKLFHYADGTNNDTGAIRLSAKEFCKKNPVIIQNLNEELNNTKFKNKILNRILFQGKSESYIRAEYLYHGTLEEGYWASREELLNERCLLSNSEVHVGNLTYQVWGRNQDRQAIHPDRRYVTQFKFSNCVKVLMDIRGNNEK